MLLLTILNLHSVHAKSRWRVLNPCCPRLFGLGNCWGHRSPARLQTADLSRNLNYVHCFREIEEESSRFSAHLPVIMDGILSQKSSMDEAMAEVLQQLTKVAEFVSTKTEIKSHLVN